MANPRNVNERNIIPSGERSWYFFFQIYFTSEKNLFEPCQIREGNIFYRNSLNTNSISWGGAGLHTGKEKKCGSKTVINLFLKILHMKVKDANDPNFPDVLNFKDDSLHVITSSTCLVLHLFVFLKRNYILPL